MEPAQASGDVQQAAAAGVVPPAPVTDEVPPAPVTDEVVPSKADFSLMNKYIRQALLTTNNEVEIIRNDVNSPLYSVKNFEDLNLDENLLRGIYDMGFKKPSKIQETALPILITERKNMIAQSQSGTGKTAAFVLASLSRIDTSARYPQVIILSPTYELAVQTFNVAKAMTKYKPEITMKLVAKGESTAPGLWPETVLVGTPGRMIDSIFSHRNLDPKKIKVYVLDEADVMIDTQGHKTQSMRIRRALSTDCQILFFSATYDEEIRSFATAIVPNAVEIRLAQDQQCLTNIKQYFFITNSEDEKYQAVANLFGTISIGQAFIFCQTKRSANNLKEKLRRAGFEVGLISGDLTVEQRNEALLEFKEGKQRVLISTNLMARGIDIDQVTVVVNYDLPVDLRGTVDKETYLHRIGRTGRFGKEGLAINMISNSEKRMIQDLQFHFRQPIHELNPNDLEDLEKKLEQA